MVQNLLLYENFSKNTPLFFKSEKREVVALTSNDRFGVIFQGGAEIKIVSFTS